MLIARKRHFELIAESGRPVALLGIGTFALITKVVRQELLVQRLVIQRHDHFLDATAHAADGGRGGKDDGSEEVGSIVSHARRIGPAAGDGKIYPNPVGNPLAPTSGCGRNTNGAGASSASAPSCLSVILG
jgi:hypothetical protein